MKRIVFFAVLLTLSQAADYTFTFSSADILGRYVFNPGTEDNNEVYLHASGSWENDIDTINGEIESSHSILVPVSGNIVSLRGSFVGKAATTTTADIDVQFIVRKAASCGTSFSNAFTTIVTVTSGLSSLASFCDVDTGTVAVSAGDRLALQTVFDYKGGQQAMPNIAYSLQAVLIITSA